MYVLLLIDCRVPGEDETGINNKNKLVSKLKNNYGKNGDTKFTESARK